MTYWSLHTHTRYSVDDALSDARVLVDRAVELGYPALGFTDHGTMAAVAQGYKAAKDRLAFAPGVEMYLTPLHESRDRKAMHLTMAAYTGEGYRNLVALHNQATYQRFNKRGRLDLADLAEAAEAGKTAGIVVATGCRSGPVVRALTERDDIAAEQVVKALASWFPKVYVELMNHHFTADGMSDDAICTELAAIAKRVGLPMILTGDAHYAMPEDRYAHNALKQLTTWSTDPEEGEFHGYGYWLMNDQEATADLPFAYYDALAGLEDLASAIKVKIPELDTFTAKIPDITFAGKQVEMLHARLDADQATYLPTLTKSQQKAVLERDADERKVITQAEMDGYLIFVAKICDFMEDRGIWFHTRGSAAGSFTCWRLGITQYNPMPWDWDIRMDRFLSGDRTSLPDIDLDIEHGRRDEVVAEIESWGYEMRQVGTQPVYGLDFKDFDESGEEKGSLRQKYFSTLRKKGITYDSWAQVPDEEKRLLTDLAERKLIAGVGAHPGGYIVAKDAPTVGCLPVVAIASSGTVVTAFDKGEVEAMGFPKIDLLGSRVLTGLRIACTLLTGGDVDDVPRTREQAAAAKALYRSIPMDDKATLKRVSLGKTTGLFQLGGGTNRRGLMQIMPRKTRDIVAAQALMRPAPLNSGFTETYLNRRSKLQEVPEMHEDIAAETKDTYGLAIYQEQVVGILRRVGLPPAQLTKLLKAVKASGKAHIEEAKKIVAAETESITGLAKARGWSDADVAYLQGCLLDYGAGYSFGKAHSVTYGVVGYLTAYLAEHHPLEYWTGQLNAYMGVTNSRGDKIEPMLTRAARADEIRVVDAHVNHSGLGYTPDLAKKAIRKGLLSVSGIGHGCALELIAKRPFASWVDLGQRVTGKVTCAGKLVEGTDPEEAGGAVKALFEAKALAGLLQGTPIAKVKMTRKRKCPMCEAPTFPSPSALMQHCQEVHDGAHPDEPVPPATAA